MKKLLANNIKKYYGKDDCIVKAVDDISLEIECGKFTSIVGTSGSGKSTLLHCMAGLDKPTFGNVYLGENDIYTLSDDELSKISNIKIYGTNEISDRVSLVSFNLEGVHPHDLTSFLDEKGICIRAGHQCTQPLLGKLGTYSVARASLYFYNTKEEIDFFIQVLKETKEFFENEF